MSLALPTVDPRTDALVTALDNARYDNHPTGNHARGFRLGLTADRLARGEMTYAQALDVAREWDVDV